MAECALCLVIQLCCSFLRETVWQSSMAMVYAQYEHVVCTNMDNFVNKMICRNANYARLGTT